jgi:carbonic anhydrase
VNERQSPIDIPPNAAVRRVGLDLDYGPVPLVIADNDYAVQVDCAPGWSAIVDGVRYQLMQFHLHCPSEHTLEGRHSEGELHLVHARDSGEVAVIGVLLTIGAAHAGLQPLVAALLGEPDTSIDPATFPPPDRKHVRYDGSLTTPPYSEGVAWRVFTTPVEISEEQLRVFEAIHKGNVRPIQPMNGRVFR